MRARAEVYMRSVIDETFLVVLAPFPYHLCSARIRTICFVVVVVAMV